MRAISIRQPFADQISRGTKKNEFRSWRTLHRGPLLVCASAKKYKDLPSGCAICIVDVVDCKALPNGQGFAWRLKNPRPVAEQFPVQGKLGFYDVKHPSLPVAGASDTSRRTLHSSRRRGAGQHA